MQRRVFPGKDWDVVGGQRERDRDSKCNCELLLFRWNWVVLKIRPHKIYFHILPFITVIIEPWPFVRFIVIGQRDTHNNSSQQSPLTTVVHHHHRIESLSVSTFYRPHYTHSYVWDRKRVSRDYIILRIDN